MGVLHGDEIDYVFGNPLNSSRRFTEVNDDDDDEEYEYVFGNPLYSSRRFTEANMKYEIQLDIACAYLTKFWLLQVEAELPRQIIKKSKIK